MYTKFPVITLVKYIKKLFDKKYRLFQGDIKVTDFFFHRKGYFLFNMVSTKYPITDILTLKKKGEKFTKPIACLHFPGFFHGIG